MDSNSKGCIAEYKFGIECIKRDINISYPIMHTSVYDCIADTGDKMYRIQIKSSFQDFQKKYTTDQNHHDIQEIVGSVTPF